MSNTNSIKQLKIEKAVYLNGHTIALSFNNGKKRNVDFKPFLDAAPGGLSGKYQNPQQFRKFLIEDGNIVWGKNWDLIFPVKQLYSGRM